MGPGFFSPEYGGDFYKVIHDNWLQWGRASSARNTPIRMIGEIPQSRFNGAGLLQPGIRFYASGTNQALKLQWGRASSARNTLCSASGIGPQAYGAVCECEQKTPSTAYQPEAAFSCKYCIFKEHEHSRHPLAPPPHSRGRGGSQAGGCEFQIPMGL